MTYKTESILLDKPTIKEATTKNTVSINKQESLVHQYHVPNFPKAHRRHRMPGSRFMSAKDKPIPSIITLKSMPGQASMHLLMKYRLLEVLSPDCAFQSSQARNLFGRASITERLLPYGVAACNTLAAWIWVGGIFPSKLDIVSNSHFRTPIYGHIIRVHNRQLAPEQLMKLGKLWATSPIRTACDLACEQGIDQQIKLSTIYAILERYHATCENCLTMLEQNPRWPGHSTGIQIIQLLRKIL